MQNTQVLPQPASTTSSSAQQQNSMAESSQYMGHMFPNPHSRMPVIGQYQSIPTQPQGQPHMQQQIQQCPHLQQLQQHPHEQMQQYFHAQQVPVPQHQGQYAPQQRLLTQPHHEQRLPQQQFTMQQPQFAQQPPQPQHHQFPAPQNPHHQYALPNQGQRQSQQGPQSTHNPPRAPNASPTTISRPQNPPIATQWLQHAKQDLQNPPPIMAPGIPPQHRIPLEKLTRMLKPSDILWVRSLHPNDRLKVYKKMQDAGRMMRGLDPNHQAYQSGWKSICDINERLMDEEREWYSKWVSDDPGIQAQLNVEFLQICVGQMQPWPLPTQPPAPQHPAQGSNNVGLLALSNTSARMVQGIQHKTASTQGSGAQRSQLIAHVREQRPPQAHHSASVGTSATTSVLPQADDDDVLFLSSTTLSPLEARNQQHTATPPDHSSANTITPDLLLPHAPENKKKRKAPTENGDAAPKKKTKKQQAEEEQIRADLQAQAKAREQAEAEAQAKAQELEDEDPLDKAMREGFEQAKKVEKAEKREEASKKATTEKIAFEEEYEKDPQRIEAWYLLGHPSRRAKDPMWQKMNAWNKHKRSAVPQPPPPFNRAEQGLASKSPEEAEQPQQEIQEEPPRAVKKPRKTTAEKSPAQQEALTPAAQSTSCPKETQLPAEQPPKAAKAPKKKAQKGPAKQSAATPRAQTPAPVVSAPVSAQVSQEPMSLPVSPLQISQPAAPVVNAPTLEPAEPETEDFNLEQALFEGLEELEETPATSLHLQLPPQPAKAAPSAAKQAVAQQTPLVLQASKPKEPPKTAPFQQASTPQQAQAPAVPFGPAPLPQTEEVVPKPAAPTPQSSMAPKPKRTLPGPSAKQRAGEAVLEFMHKRNVATDQKRDLREDERLVVGGIDVEQLFKANEEPQQIIKMITPHVEERMVEAAESFWGDLYINDLHRPKPVAKKVVKQVEQSGAQVDGPSNGAAPAALPADWQKSIQNATDEDWANVDITADDETGFFEALGNLPDSFVNNVLESALTEADQAQQDRPIGIFQDFENGEFVQVEQFPGYEEFHIGEAERASEFQRQMDMMVVMDMLPEGLEASVWKDNKGNFWMNG